MSETVDFFKNLGFPDKLQVQQENYTTQQTGGSDCKRSYKRKNRILPKDFFDTSTGIVHHTNDKKSNEKV